MDQAKCERMIAGLEPWLQNFDQGMENRGTDGLSWYDLSLFNALPAEKELAIIVTAWQGQLKWLAPVLKKYRESGAYVILSYDIPFYPWERLSHEHALRHMPNPYHYIYANSVVHKHITYDGDKRNGWFWNARYAQSVLKGFPNIKYVYLTNGDCICEKPEGFKDVISLLGDAEIMAGQSNDSVVHTADVMFKVDAFHRIFDYIYNVMKVPVIGSRSPEGMLREAITNLKIKLKHAPKQPIDASDNSVDMYSRYDQESTWKELLGYKNLFAIQETKGNEGREPVDKKYIDDYMDFIYFSGEERETICQFYRTGDRRYLYMWLDRWEDSDYNRFYTDLNYWAKQPVLDRADDKKYYREIPS